MCVLSHYSAGRRCRQRGRRFASTLPIESDAVMPTVVGVVQHAEADERQKAGVSRSGRGRENPAPPAMAPAQIPRAEPPMVGVVEMPMWEKC